MPKLSAGILLYRRVAGGELEVLLVHPGGPFWQNKDSHAWSVPKGEYRVGADVEQEALREFREELGVGPPEGPRVDLGMIRQSSGKQVRVWAVEGSGFVPDVVLSNEFDMEWPPKSGEIQRFPEVDRAEWMDLATARERVVVAQAEFFDRLLAALSD